MEVKPEEITGKSVYEKNAEETSDVKNYVYKEIMNNQKCFIFNRRNTKTEMFKYMKDGSNIDEFLKLYESDDFYFSRYNFINETGPIGTDKYNLIQYNLRKNEVIDKEKQQERIDNGFYKVGESRELGYFLKETEPSTGDKFIDLGGHLDSMRGVINKFYDKKDVYKEFGMKHKMGALFYGAPGNGKTCCLREVIKEYKDKAVVIFMEGNELPSGLFDNLKKFDQEYIFIFEEVTQMLYNSEVIAELLLFLDGENSLNQQLVLATTNYPENLPANLASRPGRFDKIMEIENPTYEMRKKYLMSLDKDISEEVINETDGMSIAYLKEIFISAKINETELLDEIKENKARVKLVEKAFAKPKKGMGFE